MAILGTQQARDGIEIRINKNNNKLMNFLNLVKISGVYSFKSSVYKEL